MKVYLNDEKKSVDPWLLYDILRGLKALQKKLVQQKIRPSITTSITEQL